MNELTNGIVTVKGNTNSFYSIHNLTGEITIDGVAYTCNYYRDRDFMQLDVLDADGNTIDVDYDFKDEIVDALEDANTDLTEEGIY